jgi:hypothetical protein
MRRARASAVNGRSWPHAMHPAGAACFPAHLHHIASAEAGQNLVAALAPPAADRSAFLPGTRPTCACLQVPTAFCRRRPLQLHCTSSRARPPGASPSLSNNIPS